MRFLVAAMLLLLPASLAAQDTAPNEDVPIELVVPAPPPLAPNDARVSAADESEAPSPAPAIWTLYDDDTTIYFFGTIHALPEDFAWRNAKLDEVIEGSDILYLEIADDGFDVMRFIGMLGRLGVNLDHPTIRERIDPDLHDEFEAVLKKIPIPESGFDNLDSWLAAILIYEFTNEDYADSEGADAQLQAIFDENEKPVRSLENGIAHYGFFDALSEAAQLAFLESMLSDDEDDADNYKQMIIDWAAGNVAAIDDDDWFKGVDPAIVAEFDKAILDDRNAKWVIEAKRVLAEEQGTFLIAGGAAHFAGENSVIDMLEKQGFSVKRVQ